MEALEPEYRALLEAVDYAPTDVDTLVERTRMPVSAVASMLLILELQGYVESAPGAGYTRLR